MKNLFFLQVISLFFGVLMLFSCGNSDEDNPTSSTISYAVDGVNVTSRASAVVSVFVDNDDSTTVDIFESNFGGFDAELLFTVNNVDNLVGTYNLVGDDDILLVDSRENQFIFYRSSICTTNTGTLTITEQDADRRTMSGTFEGTVCADNGSSIPISGSFDRVRYVVQIQVDNE